MFKGFNLFGGEKKEAPKEPDDNLKLDNKEEKKDPLEGLSLEEKIKVLEEKKNEISKLEEERLEYYYKAKDLEDRMISVGLSKEQRKKIKEQISSEGGEISQKIIDIRNEYGIEPTPVEILSNRMIIMMSEKERLSKNLQLEEKEKLNFINSTIEQLRNNKSRQSIISNFLLDIKHRYMENSEDFDRDQDLFDLSDQINSIMEEKPGDYVLVDISLTDFSTKLKESIKKNSLYKTPLEEKNVLHRYSKVLEIMDNIHSELKKARQGEGRYAKKQ